MRFFVQGTMNVGKDYFVSEFKKWLATTGKDAVLKRCSFGDLLKFEVIEESWDVLYSDILKYAKANGYEDRAIELSAMRDRKDAGFRDAAYAWIEILKNEKEYGVRKLLQDWGSYKKAKHSPSYWVVKTLKTLSSDDMDADGKRIIWYNNDTRFAIEYGRMLCSGFLPVRIWSKEVFDAKIGTSLAGHHLSETEAMLTTPFIVYDVSEGGVAGAGGFKRISHEQYVPMFEHLWKTLNRKDDLISVETRERILGLMDSIDFNESEYNLGNKENSLKSVIPTSIMLDKIVEPDIIRFRQKNAFNDGWYAEFVATKNAAVANSTR